MTAEQTLIKHILNSPEAKEAWFDIEDVKGSPEFIVVLTAMEEYAAIRVEEAIDSTDNII